METVQVELASEATEASMLDQLLDEDNSSILSDCLKESQFAQVVFHGVADSYTNDCDLICHFTLTDLVDVKEGDMVGIYRVPHVSPLEYMTMLQVNESEGKNGGKDFSLQFQGSDLPKEEDFFQYQYIRHDNCVIGASIPFQLRSPILEELCTIEDKEFMVVRSNTSHMNEQYKDQIKELEEKYSELLATSEKKIKDLETKNLSYYSHWEQAVNSLNEITENWKRALSEKDELLGKVDRAEKEKNFYLKEAKASSKKAEELNDKLMALSLSKERESNLLAQKTKELEELTQEKNALEQERKTCLEKSSVTSFGKELLLKLKEEELSELRIYSDAQKLKCVELEQRLNLLLQNANSHTSEESSSEEPAEIINEKSALQESNRERMDKTEEMLKDLKLDMQRNVALHQTEIASLKKEIELLKTERMAASKYLPVNEAFDDNFIDLNQENDAEAKQLISEQPSENDCMTVQYNQCETGARPKYSNVMQFWSKFIPDGNENEGPENSKFGDGDSREDEEGQRGSHLFDYHDDLPWQYARKDLNAHVGHDESNATEQVEPPSINLENSSVDHSSESDNIGETNFVLTDDGRPVEHSEELQAGEDLHCPVCDFTVKREKLGEMQMHVDLHFRANHCCPICDQSFPVDAIQDLEKHVQSHFDTEDFSLLDQQNDDVQGDRNNTAANAVYGASASVGRDDQPSKSNTNDGSEAISGNMSQFVDPFNIISSVTSTVRGLRNLNID